MSNLGGVFNKFKWGKFALPQNFFNSLQYKQAKITVWIAFFMGIVLNSVQIAVDLSTERKQVDSTVTQVISMIRESAIIAVYNMDRLSGEKVVRGMFNYQPICKVTIVDETDSVFATQTRPLMSGYMEWLVELLFSREKNYSIPLIHIDSDQPIGRMDVSVDSYMVLANFIERAKVLIYSGLVRNIILSFILTIFFYYSLTHPLLKIVQQVSKVDWEKPSAKPLDIPSGHDKNEMGMLVRITNRLLDGFENSLSRQRAAKEEISKHRDHLEELVTERTFELQKSTTKIKDSIQYAKTIQLSLLPNMSPVKDVLPDSFFVWQPRDVVGGDIYSVELFPEGLLLVVIDCTGHGVPGALMTMVASSALRGIVVHEKCHDPSLILQRLNFLVKASLQQDKDHTNSDDGLEAAVCFVEWQSRKVIFAGASLPLFMVNSGKVSIIKADRVNLGYKRSDVAYQFNNHSIAYDPGTNFYITTDGLLSQNGGEHKAMFGKNRFKKLLLDIQGNSFERQEELIIQALNTYQGDQIRCDDVTMVGFNVNREEPV